MYHVLNTVVPMSLFSVLSLVQASRAPLPSHHRARGPHTHVSVRRPQAMNDEYHYSSNIDDDNDDDDGHDDDDDDGDDFQFFFSAGLAIQL